MPPAGEHPPPQERVCGERQTLRGNQAQGLQELSCYLILVLGFPEVANAILTLYQIKKQKLGAAAFRKASVIGDLGLFNSRFEGKGKVPGLGSDVVDDTLGIQGFLESPHCRRGDDDDDK